VSYLLPPPCPVGSLTIVGAPPPPFAPPPPLWYHRRPCRDARPGAVTAPACAVSSWAAQAARCAHGLRQCRERGLHALCVWAEPAL
jgi:hypothetical protein